MIDHLGLDVRDLKISKDFYARILAPLGYNLLKEFPASMTGNVDVVGFGVEPKADFWLAQSSGEMSPLHLHIAFLASSREIVDAFYEAGLAAGGKDNGPPGVREIYHPDYYGAFILDPDGHNIEAVCHKKVK